MTFRDCIKEINSLQGRGIHTGLGTMLKACKLLGHPEKKFKSIHIAGTNGKGSTVKMTAEILKRAGYKTGLTISPHLFDLRERIQLDGKWISKKEMSLLHQLLKKKVGHLDLTYFEWIILMAFCFFAQNKVDFAVIETGLGGRWDATNVIKPVVAAITNVSFDHEAYLGNTLEKILIEKMQIFKKGIPAITGIEDDALLKKLNSYCKTHAIPLSKTTNAVSTALIGDHQKKNAALATQIIQTLRKMKFKISDKSVADGLKKVTWPGRLDTIYESPKIIVDGAHNRAGIDALALFLKSLNQKVNLVFATLKDRPFAKMLKTLMPYAKTLTLASFDGDTRTFNIDELRQMNLQKIIRGKRRNVINLTLQEWRDFIRLIPKSETVVVAGSLYLVSKVVLLTREMA